MSSKPAAGHPDYRDRCVICNPLSFDKNLYETVRRLAAMWCAEPSVHGGKKRSRGAKLVVYGRWLIVATVASRTLGAFGYHLIE